MIEPISKKQFRQIEKERKIRNMYGFMIFQASNGRYYRCDKSGMRGVEEVVKFKKKIDRQIQDQLELL